MFAPGRRRRRGSGDGVGGGAARGPPRAPRPHRLRRGDRDLAGRRDRAAVDAATPRATAARDAIERVEVGGARGHRRPRRVRLRDVTLDPRRSDGFDLGQLGRERAPEDGRRLGEVEAVPRGVDERGQGRRRRSRPRSRAAARRRPRARSGRRRSRRERRAAVDDGDDRRAAAAARDDARQADLDRGPARSRLRRAEHLLLLEVDGEDAVDGRGRARSSQAPRRAGRPRAPSRDGPRPPARGRTSAPARYAAREGVARRRSGRRASTALRGHARRPPVREDERAARPERDQDLGHPSERSAASSGSPSSTPASSSASFRIETCAQHGGVEVASRAAAAPCAPGRTSPCPSNETRRPRASSASVSAGKSDEAAAPTCTQRTPLGSPRDVLGRPRRRRRVDDHLPPVALVAERERRRGLPVSQTTGSPSATSGGASTRAVRRRASRPRARGAPEHAAAPAPRGTARRRAAAARRQRGRARGSRRGRAAGTSANLCQAGEQRQARRRRAKLGSERRHARVPGLGVVDELRPPARPRPARATGRARSRRARPRGAPAHRRGVEDVALV